MSHAMSHATSYATSHSTPHPTPPHPTPTRQPRVDPKIGLTFSMSHKLAALFTSTAVDAELAWEMAVSAIEAYRPESRADYVNVARTIAFSMSAMTLLGDANVKTLALSEKLRLFGRAIALDRSANQSERTMMQRQRLQRADPRPDHATNFPPRPDPQEADLDLDDAAAEAAVAEAVEVCRAAINRETSAAPATQTRPAPNTLAKPAPLPAQSPAELPAAAQPSAIHYSDPTASQPTLTRKQQLLRNTALHQAVDHATPAQPSQSGPNQSRLNQPQPNQPQPDRLGTSQPASLAAMAVPHATPDHPANHSATR